MGSELRLGWRGEDGCETCLEENQRLGDRCERQTW